MKAAGELWFVVGEAQDGGGKGKELAPSQSLIVPRATSAFLGPRRCFPGSGLLTPCPGPLFFATKERKPVLTSRVRANFPGCRKYFPLSVTYFQALSSFTLLLEERRGAPASAVAMNLVDLEASRDQSGLRSKAAATCPPREAEFLPLDSIEL